MKASVSCILGKHPIVATHNPPASTFQVLRLQVYAQAAVLSLDLECVAHQRVLLRGVEATLDGACEEDDTLRYALEGQALPLCSAAMK